MRLVTRSDFDGLICAVILKEQGIIDSYKFVHPKDIQDGKVEGINSNDVLANVPYWPGCGMWFDHHSSEKDTIMLLESFNGESRPADSCARIIYEYYGGKNRFPQFEEMIEAVDRSDSGKLTAEDIENPQDWILLSFIMDPRSGFGKYKSYRISNYALMEKLIECCRTMPIEEILQDKDVKERIDRYMEHEHRYAEMLKKKAEIRKNCIIIDLRDREKPYVGNRFREYVLFPKQNISVRIMKGKSESGKIVVAIGHSIINKSCKLNVGELCSRYGGGGHDKVGTCQIPVALADDIIEAIINEITEVG